MFATFERFEIYLSETDAFIGSHPGRCDEDILYLRTIPYIAQQLDDIDENDLRDELAEYGAWDGDELADVDANKNRILWIACGNIAEENRE